MKKETAGDHEVVSRCGSNVKVYMPCSCIQNVVETETKTNLASDVCLLLLCYFLTRWNMFLSSETV